jgi:integrase
VKRHPDALITRRNYLDTRRYLEYCEEVRHNSQGTCDFKRKAMDHLLKWATDTRFTRAPEIRPTLPHYLADLGVSVVYHIKLLSFARQFFEFALRRWPEHYERVDYVYLDSLRSNLRESTVKKKKIYTLDDVRALVAVEPRALIEERIQAAVAFLFLSGMRVGAFATLPLRAIHWDQDPVQLNQYPALGVQTKGGKAANTYLLPQPELEDLRQIAYRWYQKVVVGTGGNGLYYAIFTPNQTFDPVQVAGDHRSNNVRRHLRTLCKRAGVEYLSPHHLRHGHTVWAMDKATTRLDMKAISQNLMHASLETTDRIYARMVDDEVATQLSNLGQGGKKEKELLSLLKELFQCEIGVTQDKGP